MNTCTERWLLARLYEQDLTVVDCRTSEAFQRVRIPGAAWTKEWNVDELESQLGSLGVQVYTRIVLYDEGEMESATRLYALLKNIGHPRVYILEGGFKRWYNASFPVEKGRPIVRIPTIYKNF